MVKAIKEIKKLKDQFNMDDGLCLKLVAAYADKVSEWAETPSLPGSKPMLFSEYVCSLVEKAGNAKQETKAEVKQEVKQTPVKPVAVTTRPSESPVVKSEVHVNEPKQKELTNSAYKFVCAVTDELDIQNKYVGVVNEQDEEMIPIWTKSYPLGDTGMKVKLTVVTGYKNAVIPQLLDNSGMAVKRLRPRVTGLLGEYTFTYNDKTLTFVLE